MIKKIENLNDINTEELIQKSKFVGSFCINYTTETGICIKRNFPLKDKVGINCYSNWDLTEKDKKEILHYLKELKGYSDNIFNFLLNNEVYSKKVEVKDCTKILPPWIVFPHITRNENKNQSANLYKEIFKRFYNNLTKEELEMYNKTYPIPESY